MIKIFRLYLYIIFYIKIVKLKRKKQKKMTKLANKQLCSLFSRYNFSEMKSHSANCSNPYWEEIAVRPDYHLLPYAQPRYSPNVEITPFGWDIKKSGHFF